jgi:hypothetical protein
MIKHIQLLALIVLLFTLLYCQLHAQSIIYPTSTDTLFQNDSCIIKWKNFDRSHKRVKIELYRKDKCVYKIAASRRNWKYFNWVIPSDITPEQVYSIKLSSVQDNSYYCVSDNFLIRKPSLSFIEPNKDSKWDVGKTYSLKWNYTGGNNQHVRIQLYWKDRLRHTFSLNTKNDGKYSVALLDAFKVRTSPGYRIKITNLIDSNNYVYSDSFQINNDKLLFTSLDNIPLVWMPHQDNINKFSFRQRTDAWNEVLNIVQFTDERDDTLFIGENIERSRKRMVSINEPLGMWCQEHMQLLVHKIGLNTSNKDCTVTIKGIIRHFFVLESSSYEAKIIIKFMVFSRDGTLLWEGTKAGEANNWGTSYKAVNYYECISDAFIDVITELFTDKTIRNAIR